jgi:nitrite reductase/ring-hydroxylating ferredoxin subunit
MAEKKDLAGPDLARGIPLTELTDGSMLQGHVKGEPILVARRGDGYFAIGAICTHYGAPLATGILVDDTVRCPWHHACFSLRTGEALGAPAGRLRRATASSSCATRCPQRNRGGPALRNCRRMSSSWAAVRQGTPRPKCCGMKDIAAT